MVKRGPVRGGCHKLSSVRAFSPGFRADDAGGVRTDSYLSSDSTAWHSGPEAFELRRRQGRWDGVLRSEPGSWQAR